MVHVINPVFQLGIFLRVSCTLPDLHSALSELKKKIYIYIYIYKIYK